WEASKQIGRESAERVRELARLRNEAARSLDYRDHFALALSTGELDETRLFATLDEVDRATAAPFTEWKRALDASLAARFRCAVRPPFRLRGRRLPPVAPRRPVLPGPAGRGRGRARPPLRGRRHRIAHAAHLRRSRPRPAAGPVEQRPLRARREEPARLL